MPSSASTAPTSAFLAVLNRYNRSHRDAASLDEKEQEDFEREQRRLASTSSVSTRISPSGTGSGHGNLDKADVPLLYWARHATAALASHDDVPSRPPLVAPESQLTTAKLRTMLKNVTKWRNVQLRLALLDEYDNDAMKKLWELLSDSAEGTMDAIDYKAFQQVVSRFDEWRMSHNRAQHQDTLELLASSAAADHCKAACLSIPSLDATLFMSCPRLASGKVEVRHVYTTFLRRVSLFKAQTELVMRNDENDGYVSEEEMEAYVHDLVASIPVLQTLQHDFLPFYCCSATRRIFWLLDPFASGKIRIDALLAHKVCEDWLEVQLALEDVPRNWFGAAISVALYEKFLSLNRNGSGMLTRSDMGGYKKGIPSVVDDGLPPGTSPLTALFITRFFETNATFNGELDYKKFVDFVLAVEFLPQCPRPHFFWNIFDLNSEGVLTPMVVNCFYREVHQKLVSAGVSPPPIDLVVQEVFDMIPTKEPLRATKEEFCKNPQVGLVCAVLIDCLAFWSYENREHQIAANQHQQQ